MVERQYEVMRRERLRQYEENNNINNKVIKADDTVVCDASAQSMQKTNNSTSNGNNTPTIPHTEGQSQSEVIIFLLNIYLVNIKK